MKVLHLGKYFSPFKGGIENMMLALMKAQVKAGCKVSAIVHRHNVGEKYDYKQQFNCNIYWLPIVSIVLFVPLALSAPFYIARVIKREQPDVIHCHMPNLTCFWLLFLPAARRIPWVLHWHSDVIGERPLKAVKLLYPFYRLFEYALLKKASRIIATSKQYVEDSSALAPFQQKCCVVPLGLPLGPLPSSTRERLPNNNVKLLCIGRLTYYKGHQYLLQALHAIKAGSQTLTIIGGGELASQLTLLSQQLGVDARTQFMGQVDDAQLRAALQECDILILPSIEKTEAFGLVLLEAMREGKPCICTDVKGSGMSEVIEHNVNGLVAKHADVESLARCIELLSNSETLRERLGHAGRLKFERTYSIDKVAASINEIYRKLQ